MALLFLGKSAAFNVPSWFIALMLGVAVLIGALAQWIASAKSRRQKVTRFVLSALPFIAVVILWDCGFLPDWLCWSI